MNVYHSVRREKIESFLYKLTYQLIADVVEEKCSRDHLPETDKQFIADFYKYGFVGIMLDWIDRGMIVKCHTADPTVLCQICDGDLIKRFLFQKFFQWRFQCDFCCIQYLLLLFFACFMSSILSAFFGFVKPSRDSFIKISETFYNFLFLTKNVSRLTIFLVSNDSQFFLCHVDKLLFL